MEENKKSMAEIEKEYKEALAKKTAMMREELEKIENEKQLKAEEEAKNQREADFKAAVEAEVKKQLDGLNAEDGIGDTASSGETQEPDKEIKFAQQFAKKQGLQVFKSYESLIDNYLVNDSEAFIATDSDSGCEDDVSAWECVDCFADMIWQSVLCHSDFLAKGITVKGLAFEKGCAGIAQIRVINTAAPSKDFEAMSPCKCMSCVSNTFTSYTLTMKQYGDYKVLCDLDLFTAGDVLKTAILKSMSDVAQERIDNEIITNLNAATPTYTASLGASCGGSRGSDADCCTYTVDLYDKIVDLEAAMRAAGYFRGVDPILIISPTVAAYLKYKDGLNMPSYIASSVRMDGLKLAQIGNIRVIESCHANSCATSATVQAILLDPSRAIGEAWGKRPEFKIDDDPIECESQKIVFRMWAAFSVLDNAAIGHILNP